MAAAVRVLVVRDASGAERVVPLDRDVVTVGRDPSCTIRLDSPYVSRQHARIEAGEAAATLVDLGSRNGSVLNGVRVQGTARLSTGDVIAIADVRIECLGETPLVGATQVYEPDTHGTRAPDVLRVDAQLYEVWIGERKLERRLSAQEFQLLRHLYEHRDRVCTREELGDAIWGADRWDMNMLHRLVHRLKEKIEPQPDQPRYVQSVPWIGYRLTP